jgi:formate dehydrogenase alpha subunit
MRFVVSTPSRVTPSSSDPSGEVKMSQLDEKITINIDNRIIPVERGMTILRAAEKNGIYIPTLCAHQDLTPFGGCRMCIVEVEGMRGLPTACTTPIEEGMVIRTNTAQIQAERMEILQLILSEHTSSCLICEENEECKKFMGTIRKSGVTTGCRYCPNDRQCELQEVADKVGIKEIGYPIYYRNLQVEKEDPFYDRDYNLCILCGRCIRMCQEIRNVNTLAFKQRGRYTVIGPAFHRTHLEAGCEFCGACVSVCPTGALAEKARKWEGEANGEEITTCPLCGVGCQMRLQTKEGRIIGSLPADDRLINQGQLCVRGRFCVTELVSNHQRLRKPYLTQKATRVETTWEDAVGLAAEKLSTCSPDEFGMLVSPNCSNEDLYLAQKFTRLALNSNNIDTTSRTFYGSGFNAYLNLLKRSVPLSDIRKASVILCIGLDSRFGRSVVSVALRQAIRQGAKIITIHPRPHNLSVIADLWISPVPGNEIELFHSLVNLTEKKKRKTSSRKSEGKSVSLNDQLTLAAEMLQGTSFPVILIGSEFMQFDLNRQILEAVERLAQNINAGILALPAQNNLVGSILMGTYPEFLPGGFSSGNKAQIDELNKQWKAKLPELSTSWNFKSLQPGEKLKVLYVVGETLPNLKRLADFVIFQNIYPPDPWQDADLVLPAATFTETDGTFINGEGRIQRVRKAAEPSGEALPDWKIFCLIAQKMGKKGFDFDSASEVFAEISRFIKDFKDFEAPPRTAKSLTCEGEFNLPQAQSVSEKKPDKGFPLLLVTSAMEHTYRGYPLTDWVEGAEKLFSAGILEANPEDAEKIGISSGDEAVVTSKHFERIWPVKITPNQPKGTVRITLRYGESLEPNPCPVRIKSKNV